MHRNKQGVYFAKNAQYSVKYCASNLNIKNGQYCMLACRVLIGDIAKGSKNCEPPLKSDGISRVETLVNDINNPTIFVTTRDYCALPVYYIWFKQRKYYCWAKNCLSQLEYIYIEKEVSPWCSCCCKKSSYMWRCPNKYEQNQANNQNCNVNTNNIGDHPHKIGFDLCQRCVKLNRDSYWHSRWTTINSVRFENKQPQCWICDDNTVMNYVLVGSKQLYNGRRVYCDNGKCKKNCLGYVWHCPNDENENHPNGFDLCPDCAVDTFYQT